MLRIITLETKSKFQLTIGGFLIVFALFNIILFNVIFLIYFITRILIIYLTACSIILTRILITHFTCIINFNDAMSHLLIVKRLELYIYGFSAI